MALSELPTEMHPSRSLSVDIPPSSSAESSVAPSPTGILEGGNTSPSCSSLHSHSLNVKFAPLPELAPRKRRSTAPLGMAARGQLMRRRRGYGYEEPATQGNNSIWSDEEISDHRHQLKQQAKAQADAEGRGDDMDDAFLALGRMVKGAGKTLWRRVSHKELSKESEKAKKEEEDKKAAAGKKSGAGDNEKPTLVLQDTRNILAPLRRNVEEPQVEEEGRVWEEEIDEQFPLHVGQTETIVEGRAMYSRSSTSAPTSPTTITGKVEVVANNSLPPTTKTPSLKS